MGARMDFIIPFPYALRGGGGGAFLGKGLRMMREEAGW